MERQTGVGGGDTGPEKRMEAYRGVVTRKTLGRPTERPGLVPVTQNLVMGFI
jgi:hypothetical protein